MPINKTHRRIFHVHSAFNSNNMKIQKTIKHLCGRFLATVALTLTAVITARADYQSTVLADHPLAFYPINSSVDPAGQTATDLSGNGNNGTYNGTDPEFNTVPGPSSFIPTALFFDGFTSFVDLSTGGNPALLKFLAAPDHNGSLGAAGQPDSGIRTPR